MDNAIKSRFLSNGQGIAFYWEGSSSFGNGFARNGVNNSSSSHTNNQKNKLSVLVEGSKDGINHSTFSAENKISINFSVAKTKFYLSLHYNGDESYFYINKSKICKFKVNSNTPWYNFCLWRISKDFTNDK